MTDHLPNDTDDKYITFRRSEFYTMMGYLALPPWEDADGTMLGGDIDCAVLSEKIQAEVSAIELDDAVVIRRRDLFASPCLATYASMIALVAKNITDLDQAHELMLVADYFERQACLAADEGTKFPTIA